MSNKKFTKDDLKAGYIVKMRDGSLNMVTINSNEELIAVDKNGGWMRISQYDDGLRNTRSDGIFVQKPDRQYDIVEVYGGCKQYHHALALETSDRELLWTCEEPKEMTIEEIENALGYHVKIVNK